MDITIIILSAVNIVLALTLMLFSFSLRRLKERSSKRGEEILNLEKEIRNGFENIEKENSDFRKEVQAYLEKTMTSSYSSQKELYKELDEQNKAINETLTKLNEKIASSLMDLRLQNRKESGETQEKVRVELEKIRLSNEKAGESASAQLKELFAIVHQDMEKIREDNDKKLDEMRKTVDEKLQSTLETRLTESFKLVSNNLDQLRAALSEINKLSRDVNDLNKMFGNVKSRGVWGEVQIEAILSDILTPEQYVKNFHPKERREDVVEFAVRLPGKGDGSVYIPIDSKFPKEDYERYVEAVGEGNEEKVSISLKALRERVRKEAQDIAEKYINPPRTTDFAILFVPTESLYAELLRDPGYVDNIQTRYKVIISGPTTFSALLVSLGMGFRTLQIEKKTKEVRDLFAKIKVLMQRFSEELVQTQNAIGTAGKRIDQVIKRNNMISSRLQNIELGDDQEGINIQLDPKNTIQIE